MGGRDQVMLVETGIAGRRPELARNGGSVWTENSCEGRRWEVKEIGSQGMTDCGYFCTVCT